MRFPIPLPPDYFAETQGTPFFDAELDAILDYRAEQEANPHTTDGSSWTWGDQLVIAQNPFTHEPMHLPIRSPLDGIMIEGRPGTGKTGIIGSILIQAIHDLRIKKVYYFRHQESRAAFADAVIEGVRAGRRVRWITNVPGKASFGLPLLQTILASGLPALDIAATFVDAFGYKESSSHVEGHWLDAKEMALGYLLALNQLPPGEQTFAHAAKLLATLEPRQEFNDAFRDARTQLMKVFLSLASLDCINCQGGLDDRAMIDLRKSFVSDEPELIILELVPVASRLVASVFPQLFFRLQAEAVQTLPTTDDLRILNVIDDADPYDSIQTCKVLEPLRPRGVGLVLASKDISAFEANAATTIYLSCETQERLDYFIRRGGKELRVLSQSFRTEYDDDAFEKEVGPRINLPDEYYGLMNYDRELIRNITNEAIQNTAGPQPRFSDNDIFALLAQPGYGFICSSTDQDIWQQAGTLVPAFFDFCTSPAEHDRRRGLPWPSPPGTLPVAYSDLFAELLRTNAGKPKTTQGTNWRKLADEIERGKRPQ